MPRRVLGTLLAIVLAGSCIAAPYSASDLFPMETGDFKVYELNHPLGMQTLERHEVVDSYYSWRKWDGHPFGEGWFRNGQRWLGKWTQGHTEWLLNAQASSTSIWQITTDDPCLQDADARLLQSGVTVQTRAGVFQDCLVFDITSSCNDAGLGTITVAPGVGIVRYTQGNIAGVVVAELIEAQVGSKHYPLPAPRFKVQGTTDKAVYAHRALPGLPTSIAAAEIGVELSISNESAQDLPIWYSGNYSYDFTLAPVNDQDNPVYRWSHMRAFTKNLVYTTLRAGETVSYHETLPVQDNNGVRLPAGLYVLRGWWGANPQSGSGFSAIDCGFELTIEVEAAGAPIFSNPFIPAPQTYDAADLFRLDNNAEWVYEVRNQYGTSGEHTIETTNRSGSWFYLSGSPFGDGWFRNYDTASQHWVVQWDGHYEGLVDAHADLNDSWPIAARDACLRDAEVVLVDKTAVLQTAAGRFYNCHVYDVHDNAGNCADAGLTRFVLAPGFGLVQFFTQSIIGPVEHIVKRMNLNGAVYPKPAGLQVEMVAEVVGGQLHSTLTFANQSSSTWSSSFSSGQTMDIWLSQATDRSNLFQQWSANQFFTMATQTIDVQPGQPWVISAQMPFADFNGNALSEARVRHATVGDRPFGAEVILKP